MDALHTARADLKELEAQEALLEEKVIDALQGGGSTAHGTPRTKAQCTADVVLIEQDIAVLRQRMEDQTNLIEYYTQRAETSEHLSSAEVFTLAYQSTRLIPPGVSLEEADDMLSRRSLRWSEANGQRRLTSLLVATSRGFFGVLEGYDREEVEAAYQNYVLAASTWHKDCSIVYTQLLSARQYPVGVLLRTVEDPLLSTFVDAIRERGLGAVHYAAPEALRTLRKGGDPTAIPPSGPAAQKVILTVMFDRQCGAVHTAATYDSAAMEVERIVNSQAQQQHQQQGGRGVGGASSSHYDIVEKFGEFMTVIFPLNGTNPSTVVCSVAEQIHNKVPYCVVSVHIGPVSEVHATYCVAYGQGIRDSQRLCQLAENERRPMIITPIAHERCSKAVHPFSTFTLDNVRYHTLRNAVGEKRLHPKPDAIWTDDHTSSWMDTVPSDSTNTIAAGTAGSTRGKVMNSFEYRAVLAAEKEAEAEANSRGHEPLVKGALTNAEMKQMFRELGDVGNAGWISKEKFKAAIAESTRFPVFSHDLKKVDYWLGLYNRIGKDRLSFEEFAILCLKMEQQ